MVCCTSRPPQSLASRSSNNSNSLIFWGTSSRIAGPHTVLRTSSKDTVSCPAMSVSLAAAQQVPRHLRDTAQVLPFLARLELGQGRLTGAAADGARRKSADATFGFEGGRGGRPPKRLDKRLEFRIDLADHVDVARHVPLEPLRVHLQLRGNEVFEFGMRLGWQVVRLEQITERIAPLTGQRVELRLRERFEPITRIEDLGCPLVENPGQLGMLANQVLQRGAGLLQLELLLGRHPARRRLLLRLLEALEFLGELADLAGETPVVVHHLLPPGMGVERGFFGGALILRRCRRRGRGGCRSALTLGWRGRLAGADVQLVCHDPGPSPRASSCGSARNDEGAGRE